MFVMITIGGRVIVVLVSRIGMNIRRFNGMRMRQKEMACGMSIPVRYGEREQQYQALDPKLPLHRRRFFFFHWNVFSRLFDRWRGVHCR